MATDQERLIVSVEARITDLERNMRRAAQVSGQNFDQIERRAKTAGQRIEKSMADASSRVTGIMKNFGAGLAGGIIGGLSVAGLEQLLGKVGKVAEGVAMIGSNAKRAGINVRAMQELSYVADQNRISVDALTDGIKELQLRADEWIVTGAGPAAESFQRLGFTASQLKERLKDPSALLVEIIDRMEELDRASQIRIADELFGGTAGERFVELLDRGAAGIRQQIQEANELGLVLDADVIQRADEIDRKFKMIAATIETGVKSAVVDVASALLDWYDGLNAIEEQNTRSLGIRLQELGQQRIDNENEILRLRDQQANAILSPYDRTVIADRIKELEAEQAKISEAEQRILKLLDDRDRETEEKFGKAGEAAKQTTPAVNTLNDALQKSGATGASGAKGIIEYGDAIRALKNEIPELAEQLATLDAKTRIDGAYRAALQKARTIGETIEAGRLRDTALAALSGKGAREAAGLGMLSLIGYAEGTDRGRGYNETLGFGRFTGGNRNLVMMTLDEVDAMQTAMLRHPDNTFNSSAAGRYQIVQKTLRGLRGDLGLRGDELFDKSMQDRLAEELLRRRGNDVGGLRNEWEGLRRVDDATIRAAYDGTSVTMPAIDPNRAANIESAREQATAYAEIVARAKEYTSQMGTEQAALNMTTVQAARLRYEQQMLNDAQRQGIQLTPEQRQQIGQLAQGMAQAEASVNSYAASQRQAAEVSKFFGQQAVDALSGILTGTMSAEDALRNLLNALVKAALQAAILGEGPLAGLLQGEWLGGGGGGKAKAGGALGLLPMLFGFADGGYTGNGRKLEPAGIVHKGEVVWSQADIKRAGGVAVVETLRTGRFLPGFADGGVVGEATPSRLFRPANSNMQQINISAPVTVNASGGTPEQNQDLAERTARETAGMIRTLVTDELRTQMRPGNMLNQRF